MPGGPKINGQLTKNRYLGYASNERSVLRNGIVWQRVDSHQREKQREVEGGAHHDRFATHHVDLLQAGEEVSTRTRCCS